MQITIHDRGQRLRERLRGRIDDVARLRCIEHDQTIVAVAIHARENGWFDAMWTTCCDALARQAGAIVKDRC